jgi:hypothetical protein
LNLNCQLQSPGPSAFLVEAGETPENTEGGPDSPEPAAERDIQMEYSFDYVAQSVI